MSNNTCQLCIPPCLECLNNLDCLSCTIGYVDLYIHRCTLECNSNSYPDANFTCQPCAQPCNRCYTASSCYQCSLPYILYNGGCVTVSQCTSLNRYAQYHTNYSDPMLSA